MWVPRDWMPPAPRPNRLFVGRQKRRNATNVHARFLGQATITRSDVPQHADTGRAPRRDPDDRDRAIQQRAMERHARKIYDHKGPYLPLLMYACGEQQYAAEYEHGSVSYGAFTYVLAKTFRAMNNGASASIKDVMDATARELGDIGYAQTPQFVGAEKVYKSDLNFRDLVTAPKKLAARKAAKRKKKVRAR